MKQILKRAATFGSALALSLSSLAILAVPAVHATPVSKTWVGYDGGTPGNGCDNKFSTGACWSPAGAPDPADQGGGVYNTYTLTFDDTSDATNGRSVTNDIVGLKVDSITFSGAFASAPYTISGTQALEMTDGSTITDNSTAANADHIIDVGLNLAGDLTVNKGTNVDGLLTLDGAITTFSAKTLTLTSTVLTDPANQEAKILVSNVISGDGLVTVTAGHVDFSATNTYTGVTNVSGGLLELTSSNLGATSAGTTIANGGSVKIVGANNVADEPFTIAGGGNNQAQVGVGAIITAVNGTTLNAGKLTLSNNAAICAVSGASLDVLTPALAGFTLFHSPTGTASQSDDCGGAETVDGADTLADWTGGIPTPTPADCTSPTTLGATDATVADGTCAQIASGDTVTPAGGTLTVTGTLINNGTITGNVIVDGTLKGSGTVSGTVTVNATGHVAPGNSPGILNTGNISFVSGSSFDVEIGGTTAGQNPAGYDQVNVTGTVDVTGATLNVSAFNNFTPAVGDQFTIINNDGSDAVTGTFNGLAEGATVTVGGVDYTISYKGTDASTGNDVVLTVASVTATPINGQGGTTPTNTPATPNTGFAALMTNPATIMFSTTAVAGAILAIARKYNLLKG